MKFKSLMNSFIDRHENRIHLAHVGLVIAALIGMWTGLLPPTVTVVVELYVFVATAYMLHRPI